MNSSLFWIQGPWRGKFALLTRPRGGDWLADETRGWRDAGIDIVVSLLETDETIQFELSRESELAESQGIQFVSFPIPDRGVPPSTPEALALLSKLSAALEKGRSVAVHCRQSIGRSGLVACGLLVMSGLSAKKATELVSAARGLAIPETSEQLEWIKHLPSLVQASPS